MSEESKYIKVHFTKAVHLFCVQRGAKWTLSSHKNFDYYYFLDGDAKFMLHKEDKEGQEWIFREVYNGLYEIVYDCDSYSMKNRTVTPSKESSKEQPRLSDKESSLWKLKGKKDNESDSYKVKVQNAFTNEFLFINFDNTRDSYSYFMALTPDEAKATEFTMK